MSTSKSVVSYTSEELRARSATGGSLTDRTRVLSREPDLTDPDAPDFTPMLRATLKRLRGRPKGQAQKEATSLRIDKDVLAAWRATGRGWQTRMNDTLRAAIEAKPPTMKKPRDPRRCAPRS